MSLWKRLNSAWRALTDEPAPQPTRVGFLNTGELLVMSPEIGTLILSPETTDAVRDQLDGAFEHLLAPLRGVYTGPLVDTPVPARSTKSTSAAAQASHAAAA